MVDPGPREGRGAGGVFGLNSFCSLNNEKMGVAWIKVGVFQGKLI